MNVEAQRPKPVEANERPAPEVVAVTLRINGRLVEVSAEAIAEWASEATTDQEIHHVD